MSNLKFPPLPFEDRANGNNDNAYSSAIGHPTPDEKKAFIDEITSLAIPASNKTGIPASVIIAMAVLESGSGFTRIAQFANNLFGIKKKWTNHEGGWQLKGQPDEDQGKVKVLENMGPKRLIFDESSRVDNWYEKFNDRAECITFLTETRLLDGRYIKARDDYQNRVKNEHWALPDAAKKYAFDIAAAGYNHLGAQNYANKVGKIIDDHNLTQYDKPGVKPEVAVPAATQTGTPAQVQTSDQPQISTQTQTSEQSQTPVQTASPTPNCAQATAGNATTNFKMKYEIKKDYLNKNSQKRSGELIQTVGFVVAHDTGNPGPGAQNHVNYYKETQNTNPAAAHTFIDDKEIIECIPTGLSGDPAEKAKHVMLDKPADNHIYGQNANDVAIGVELCYGGNINLPEAYKRYVWYLAYNCHVHKLNPSWDVIGHMILDPERRSDPQNALRIICKSYAELLKDVVNEYLGCTTPAPGAAEYLLQEGSQGEDVKKLQENLSLLGFDADGVDGNFGPKTKEAVVQFQTKHNIMVDGIVGPITEFQLQNQISELCLAGKC